MAIEEDVEELSGSVKKSSAENTIIGTGRAAEGVLSNNTKPDHANNGKNRKVKDESKRRNRSRGKASSGRSSRKTASRQGDDDTSNTLQTSQQERPAVPKTQGVSWAAIVAKKQKVAETTPKPPVVAEPQNIVADELCGGHIETKGDAGQISLLEEIPGVDNADESQKELSSAADEKNEFKTTDSPLLVVDGTSNNEVRVGHDDDAANDKNKNPKVSELMTARQREDTFEQSVQPQNFAAEQSNFLEEVIPKNNGAATTIHLASVQTIIKTTSPHSGTEATHTSIGIIKNTEATVAELLADRFCIISSDETKSSLSPPAPVATRTPKKGEQPPVLPIPMSELFTTSTTMEPEVAFTQTRQITKTAPLSPRQQRHQSIQHPLLPAPSPQLPLPKESLPYLAPAQECIHPPGEYNRYYGRVAYVSQAYGFIRYTSRTENRTEDMFVHLGDVQFALSPRDSVSFELSSFRGRQKAINVRLEDEAVVEQALRRRPPRQDMNNSSPQYGIQYPTTSAIDVMSVANATVLPLPQQQQYPYSVASPLAGPLMMSVAPPTMMTQPPHQPPLPPPGPPPPFFPAFTTGAPFQTTFLSTRTATICPSANEVLHVDPMVQRRLDLAGKLLMWLDSRGQTELDLLSRPEDVDAFFVEVVSPHETSSPAGLAIKRAVREQLTYVEQLEKVGLPVPSRILDILPSPDGCQSALIRVVERRCGHWVPVEEPWIADTPITHQVMPSHLPLLLATETQQGVSRSINADPVVTPSAVSQQDSSALIRSEKVQAVVDMRSPPPPPPPPPSLPGIVPDGPAVGSWSSIVRRQEADAGLSKAKDSKESPQRRDTVDEPETESIEPEAKPEDSDQRSGSAADNTTESTKNQDPAAKAISLQGEDSETHAAAVRPARAAPIEADKRLVKGFLVRDEDPMRRARTLFIGNVSSFWDNTSAEKALRILFENLHCKGLVGVYALVTRSVAYAEFETVEQCNAALLLVRGKIINEERGSPRLRADIARVLPRIMLAAGKGKTPAE